MRKMRLLVGLYGMVLLAVIVPRADGYCKWVGKYREQQLRLWNLEDENLSLREELDTWKMRHEELDSAYERDGIPALDPRSGLQRFQMISFRQTPLVDVVTRLNDKLGSVDANQFEDAIARRRARIVALESEIEQLNDMKKADLLRRIALDLLKGTEKLMDIPITFSALDISVAETLGILADVANLAYEVDNGVARLVPRLEHRPIPKDELSVDEITSRVKDLYDEKHGHHMFRPYRAKQQLLFAEEGLQKAIDEGYVESRTEEIKIDFFGRSSTNVLVHLLTPTGVDRFRYLARYNRSGKSQSIRVATPESRRLPGQNESDLYFRQEPSDVKLLIAEEGAATDLVFRDFDTREPLESGADWRSLLQAERHDREHSGFLRLRQPEPRSGIYVYYGLDVEGIRPEDQHYFVRERAYRLEELHKHELGYFLRIPEYLREDAHGFW